MKLADAEDLWLACVCQAPRYADHSQVTERHLSARGKRVLAAIRAVTDDGWAMVTANQLAELDAEDSRTILRRLDTIDAEGSIAVAERALVDAWATDAMARAYRAVAECCETEGREAAETLLLERTEGIRAMAAGIHWRQPSEVAKQLLEQIRKRLQGEGPPRIETGLVDIDAAVRYWQPGRMTVIGGWSSQGKSTVTVQILTALSLRHTPTALISLEDEETITVRRQLAMLTDELEAVRRLTQDSLTADDLFILEQIADEVLPQLPMQLVYGPGWPVDKVCAAAQDAIRRFGARVVAVDYLQCFSSEHGRRREELGNHARAIKAAVTQLGAHLVLVSQLRRPDGADAKKTVPTMFMLKESGDIENATEYALLVHRYEKDKPGVVIEPAAVIVDKSKDGPTGRIEMGWDRIRHMFSTRSPDRTDTGGHTYDDGYTYDRGSDR